MSTYPEANREVVKLLRMAEEPLFQYAADRIEELERKAALLDEAIELINHAYPILRGRHSTLTYAQKQLVEAIEAVIKKAEAISKQEG